MLRDTIPKMLDPLVQKQPSRESFKMTNVECDQTNEIFSCFLFFEKKKKTAADALFNSFVKAVTDAQLDIREFTELMRDDKSKQIFAYVERSRQEDPLGINPWRHKDHPDWFKMERE